MPDPLGALRKNLLAAEHEARQMAEHWDNKYARLHLLEVAAQARLCLIQIDYAYLALKEGRGQV